MKITLYDTHTLLGVFRDLQPVQTYWLDFFTQEVHFDTEWIDFEKLSQVRRVAPFVMPLSSGRPIYADGSRLTRLKAAYIKPKDPVSPTRVIKKRPGTLADIGSNVSPQAIYNSLIADILQAHYDAIVRRWEWMAAQAIIHAAVIIAGEAYPSRGIDFGRDAANSITTIGTGWETSGSSPIEDIESWRNITRRALFGGPVDRITVSPDVWNAYRNNATIAAKLAYNMYMFAPGLNPNLGLRSGALVEDVGSVGSGLNMTIYSDYYQDSTGAQINYLPDGYAVLTGPGVNGYRCFGAILDPNAQFQPLSIFPRMYMEDDPAVTFVLTQSAPLMVPLNPNNTLSAQPLND